MDVAFIPGLYLVRDIHEQICEKTIFCNELQSFNHITILNEIYLLFFVVDYLAINFIFMTFASTLNNICIR